MRIAMTYSLVDRLGGIGRVLIECANLLCERGHAVDVYAAQWQDGVLDPRVDVHRVPGPTRPDAAALLGYRRNAARALAGAGSDVHAAFGIESPEDAVLWVPSVHASAVELVLSERGPAGRALQQANPYHRLRLGLEKRLYRGRRYRHLVAATAGIRDELTHHYGVPHDDVTLMPLGYDAAVFDVARRATLRDEARSELGFRAEDRVVAFVANQLERKGFDTLLEAVARLDGVHVLVAGKADPTAVAQRYGLADRVRWTGRSSDLAYCHAAADAFALPSRYEPWGLVIVEALASGLPVVTTRLSGASVTVKDGHSGQLLDDPLDVAALAAGIEWALGGGPAPPEEIAASVAWLRWEEVVERYEGVLERYA